MTLDQLESAGVTASAVKCAVAKGRLVRMFQRAYRFAVVTPTWEQRALAATLLAGSGSALTHSTAASLWSFNGFESATQHRIHLSVPARHRLDLPDDFVVHRPTTAFEVYRLHDGLPVTRLARTLVDIVPLVSDEQLEIILDAAQHRHPRLPLWLDDELARGHPAAPGRHRLTELLALRGGVATESPLETRVRRAIRRSGLPPPRVQLNVFDARRFVMRVDFAWPLHRVALHVDGFRWHAGRRPFDTDAAQRSRLSSLDWVSVIVTHSAARDDRWLQQLAQTLDHRTPQRELFAPAPPATHFGVVSPARLAR